MPLEDSRRTARRGLRQGGGQPWHELLELLVGGLDGELDAAPVEDRVVRPPDRLGVGRDGRQRAGAEAAHDLRTSNSSVVQLVQRRLDDARRDLDAAGEARRRREEQREGVLCDAGPLGHVGRRAPGRLVARLQARTTSLARSSMSRSSKSSSTRMSARPGPLAIAK